MMSLQDTCEVCAIVYDDDDDDDDDYDLCGLQPLLKKWSSDFGSCDCWSLPRSKGVLDTTDEPCVGS